MKAQTHENKTTSGNYEIVKVNVTNLPVAGAFAEMKYAMIPISLCDTSSRFRETRTIRREIASKFDPLYCDPIKVVDRPVKGCFEVIDGGKRVVAAAENGLTVIPAFIFENEEKAFPVRKFIEQDKGKDVMTRYDKHAGLLEVGDVVAIKVESIANKYNLKFTTYSGKKNMRDVPTISYNYVYDCVKNHREEDLKIVLDIIKNSRWNEYLKCYNDVFLHAFTRALNSVPTKEKDTTRKLLEDYLKKVSPEEIILRSAYQTAQDKRTRIHYTIRDEVVLANGIRWIQHTSEGYGAHMGAQNFLKRKIDSYIETNPNEKNAITVAIELGCSLQSVQKYHPELSIKACDYERYEEALQNRRKEKLLADTQEAHAAKNRGLKNTKTFIEDLESIGRLFITEHYFNHGADKPINIEELSIAMNVSAEKALGVMRTSNWKVTVVDNERGLYMFKAPENVKKHASKMKPDEWKDILSSFASGDMITLAEAAELTKCSPDAATYRLRQCGFTTRRGQKAVWIKK